MVVSCPQCTEQYDITNTIPNDHSGTITCDSCDVSFDVLKQTNSNREVLGVKTICRSTQKEKTVDLIAQIIVSKRSIFKSICKSIKDFLVHLLHITRICRLFGLH